MEQIQLEVLTPEKQALQVPSDSIYLEGAEGRLGILPGHTALIARLKFGLMEYTANGETHSMLCGDGLVEVQDEKVTILVKSAESEGEIDVDRAKQALSRAKSRRDSKDKDIDMMRAELALYRAIQRLKFTASL